LLRIARRAAPVALYLLWTLFALYPNPATLARAIPQAWAPRADPEAVRAWAARMPDDPARIEALVLDRYVPYAVPWQTHGVPWYFPTTREVVARGAGDCQARMLVLSSILEAKGIPHRLEASFDHIWVWYEGKRASDLENDAIALMVTDERGRRLRLPERWDWRETLQLEKEYFWDPMPGERKLLLFGGLAVLPFRRRLARGVWLALCRLRPPLPRSPSTDVWRSP
jgi:hypothetical protein